MEQTEMIENKKSSTAKVVGISVLSTLVVVALGAYLWFYVLFPSQFEPVTLSENETQELNQKLRQVDLQGFTISSPSSSTQSNANATSGKRLQPQPYTENDTLRRVEFSEREVNALLAHNTELADKLAIDFSNNLASALWLIPLDPEFPVLGGKTLKLSAGMELAYKAERPVVKLKGVSLWGVPIPNAWLGYSKNVDLVSEFGVDSGFWSAFADGVKELSVADGKLIIELNP